ncbi:hypothetical protein [Sphingobium sp.]|uniref:hypothetical protein n=1 Tax=Sphingobium sp. TaxID=1912891 RepID=UPI003BB613FF
MSKFGTDTDDFVLTPTRWGPRHAVKSASGILNHCSGNPALCKFCHEHGVPVKAPDPINAAINALTANWHLRWIESHRHPASLAENEIWPADGLHIVAQDDETKERTVVASFGDNDVASTTISALVHVHNEMIGRPD